MALGITNLRGFMCYSSFTIIAIFIAMNSLDPRPPLPFDMDIGWPGHMTLDTT